MSLRAVLVVALLVAGCSIPTRATIDQRTTQGPVAEEFWETKVRMANGRAPSFEEKQHFLEELNSRIGRYLREHEDAANDPLTLQSFRFLRQVTAGMQKEQVEILLGAPFASSKDAQQMANWARRHWPDIRGRADEAWGYPFGWIFYFDKGKLVDITQYLPGAPLV